MKPIVMVTRHPDYGDEIELHGVDASVIYIDLGSQFDTTPDDDDQACEWAQNVWQDVKDLPEDHPARESVRNVIGYTVERYFNEKQVDALLLASEEDCDHTDHIVGPDGRCPECGEVMS